jgi:hypothetical protein
LKTELPEAILKHFPENVIPDSDPNWDYHRQYEQVPGSVKIIQKEVADDFTYTKEFWVNGVRPKGLSVLASILNNAFREISVSEIQVKALLK